MILIGNGRVITNDESNTFIENGCIAIEGNIIKEGTTSPYSLYDEDIASFKTGDLYDHHDAEGFITLYGLSTKVRAMKLNNKK